MLRSWKYLAASVALIGALAVPVVVLAQSLPTLSLTAQAGAFTGKWVYRSFSVSSDPKATLAKLALGLNELTLTEQGGRIAGTRTGQGVSYDLAGTALYAAKQGATIRLHGTATISGKTYNYDYFGYLMPSWSVGGTQPDTIMGTVLRSDPANPANAPLIAAFAATRE
ncbi:MAG: hypothetical protein HY834_12920 [Devosia nanyangense]|uniref:Uncharacterized protein n=1 Tax=Devosia nanyangense TaxID=1228055 RepID=A0A933NZL4_9HYPH|nr:hypothetical protein [Devosia nanyangense]